MDMIKKCLNPKVLLGLGLVAVGFLIFAPELLPGVLLILLIAVCPLSMVLMMGSMGKKEHGHKNSDALDSLKQRYARGELTKAQFEAMKKDIST